MAQQNGAGNGERAKGANIRVDRRIHGACPTSTGNICGAKQGRIGQCLFLRHVVIKEPLPGDADAFSLALVGGWNTDGCVQVIDERGGQRRLLSSPLTRVSQHCGTERFLLSFSPP